MNDSVVWSVVSPDVELDDVCERGRFSVAAVVGAGDRVDAS